MAASIAGHQVSMVAAKRWTSGEEEAAACSYSRHSRVGISYRWDERLGGRRRLTAEEDAASPDPWWRVAQFRAYAAWTRTEEWRAGFAELRAGAEQQRTAICCSEAVWWRCHRRIVADVAVLAYAVPVAHLMHTGRLTDHPVSEGARIREDGTIVWDG